MADNPYYDQRNTQLAGISDGADYDDKPSLAGEKPDGLSPSSDGPARKRRRSRKGLDKRFECAEPGCGKSYSRAEHLYRHQLNHKSEKVFQCEFPGCTRTFVRGDLLKRHMDRHTAKGSSLSRRDSLISHVSQAAAAAPGSISPEASKSRPSFPDPRPRAGSFRSTQDAPTSTYSPTINGNTPPYMNGHHSNHQSLPDYGYRSQHPQPQSPSLQNQTQQPHSPFTSMSPAMHGQSYNVSLSSGQPNGSFVAQQNVMPFHLPPAQYSGGHGVPSQDSAPSYEGITSVDNESTHAHSNEMMMLNQMTMAGTVPIFGGDGVLNKSPYGGMPDDFLTYLFNSNSVPGSPRSQDMTQGTFTSYSGLQTNQYALPFVGSEATPAGYFPAAPQQVMAVNNLLDQNVPEATISEDKSQEIFDLIKDRFRSVESASSERARADILEGDRTNDNHMLSKRMMQAYIGSYWYHFSDQMPILHKPSFSPDKTPNLLLLSMMIIGAACLDRTHGQKVTKAGAKLSNFLADNLRWVTFMDTGFKPPAKLWVFQTIILLELYEKMYSTRELHERAHIHHATTIQLMRRGRSLIGKSALESPPNPVDSLNGSRHSSASGVAQTAEEWWHQWIINEATRRAAFAAFIIDSTHSTMFGHSAVMVAHEMRLPLPCDESLWQATSSAEVGRIEANFKSRDIRHVSFIEGLKRMLMGQKVATNTFGRIALISGLLSVAWHMNQRDLQVSVLGQNVSQTLGGRDKWKATLNSAYDHWKLDFDRALRDSHATVGPYLADEEKQHELETFLETRNVYHHLAHMAMHADVVDCQMYAHAKRLLGRPVGPAEFAGARKRMQMTWAPSARARDATFYALKYLRSVLFPRETSRQRAQNPGPQSRYEARDDVLLNRPWTLYFSALILWSYGFALQGAPSKAQIPSTPDERYEQVRAYLDKFGNISNPGELQSCPGINDNTALLMELKDTFEETRWELLHEGSNLLSNCIALNTTGKC